MSTARDAARDPDDEQVIDCGCVEQTLRGARRELGAHSGLGRDDLAGVDLADARVEITDLLAVQRERFCHRRQLRRHGREDPDACREVRVAHAVSLPTPAAARPA